MTQPAVPPNRVLSLARPGWLLFQALLRAPLPPPDALRRFLATPPWAGPDGPQPLRAGTDPDGFTCGVPVLDKAHAKACAKGATEENGHIRRPYRVVQDGRPLGFYGLGTGIVQAADVGRGGGPAIPVVWLNQLAVARSGQGQGLGARLLRHAIAEAATLGAGQGALAMLVLAIDHEVRGFYLAHGFRPVPKVIHDRVILLRFHDVAGCTGN
ncbi:GNAT family N-acetyltransferase [Zavarzinia sp. CC-PAN008]|uniref:GNAT family N-acetyltransferase n=1 Tax=Zavarzinia sp. CC-PAN008 TaxID=3243332 RepID=UPI003F74262F